MKKLNTNESSPAIKKVKTIDECPFVKEINKRYGFKIMQFIFICDELKLKNEGWRDSSLYHLNVVPPNVTRSSQVELLCLRDLNFKSIEEFYKETNTGFYSENHKVNQGAKGCKSIKRLIPIILIYYKRKTYSFQLNNQIIREFFEDTESLMGSPLSEEGRSLIDRRFLEHKEYLEYFYAPFKSNLCGELWIKIYYDKLISNNGNLLHSEYLKQRNAVQRETMDESIPMSLNINSI